MTNWNQVVAKGFGSADDEWGRAGSAERVDLLNKNLERLQQERQVVAGDGDLGDERRGDPGHPGDRHGAAAGEAAAGLDGPERSRRADAPAAWSTGRTTAAAASTCNNDGDIDDPGAAVMDGSWTNIANAFMKPRLGSQLDELNSLFSRFDLPPGRPVLGLVSVLRPRHQLAARQPGPEPVPERLLRQGQPGEVPERHLEGDRRLRRRDRRRRRGPTTRPRGAPTRSASRSTSRRCR